MDAETKKRVELMEEYAKVPIFLVDRFLLACKETKEEDETD